MSIGENPSTLVCPAFDALFDPFGDESPTGGIKVALTAGAGGCDGTDAAFFAELSTVTFLGGVGLPLSVDPSDFVFDPRATFIEVGFACFQYLRKSCSVLVPGDPPKPTPMQPKVPLSPISLWIISPLLVPIDPLELLTYADQ